MGSSGGSGGIPSVASFIPSTVGASRAAIFLLATPHEPTTRPNETTHGKNKPHNHKPLGRPLAAAQPIEPFLSKPDLEAPSGLPPGNLWWAPPPDEFILYVTQLCFRARNRPSRPDSGTFGRPELRPAEGRPEVRLRCFPGSSPAKIWPGRPISGPEALLPNIE